MAMYCPNRDCEDARRSGRPGEYRPETSVCPKCGAHLVPAMPEWLEVVVSPGEMEVVYEEFVPVRRLQNTALIPFAKSLLLSAGIRHFVKNENTHDLIGYARLSPGGYNPLLGEPEIFVEPSRAEEATLLLEDLEEERP